MEEFAVSRQPATRSDRSAHPYLQGNFYPQSNELHLAPCSFQGTIPDCLIGGQYVRNGPNPMFPPRDHERYHWFDGDGMLHGVFFFKPQNSNIIEPRYVNKFVKTDVYTASSHWGQTLLPSITSLIDPLTSNFAIIKSVMEAGFLAFLSGSIRLSVANTSVIYHDRRVMAMCESGPPIEITAPELETLDWVKFKNRGESLGIPGSASEWVTAHPKIDPVNGDLIMFGYDIFQFKNPFIRYSVVGHDGKHKSWQVPIYLESKSPKMMHDFACTQTHSIIIDCPLTMSPFSILSSRPMLHFDKDMPMKFGIIPRTFGITSTPPPKWFSCVESCMIFHSANAWDELDDDGKVMAVCLIACRFKGAKLVHAAGGMDLNEEATESDVVHLYYYRFDLVKNLISHSYPLSDFPMEFPTINTNRLTLPNRFVYGSSMRQGSFDAALSGAKIDVIVKADIQQMIRDPPLNVDNSTSNTPPCSPHIKTIHLPQGHYSSEATFVPHSDAKTEDDGVVLMHVYDERRAKGASPFVVDRDQESSQVWIICAKKFSLPPLAIIQIPQRVPYGLHATWLSRAQVDSQRSVSISEADNKVVVTTHRPPRKSTSLSLITNFWIWNFVWIGKRSMHGLSALRFGMSVLVAWVIFFALTWHIWVLLGQALLSAVVKIT